MKEYKNPTPTVDIIIEISGHKETETENPQPRIVIIKRKNPPFGFALPGGFVDEGEPLWKAAIREAKEETGLDVKLYEQFYTYSDPSRDPRSHTVSTVFIGTADGLPEAGDDAAEVFVTDPGKAENMVFDHSTIINDYLEFKKTGRRPPFNR